MPAGRFFEKRKHPRFTVSLKCTATVLGHSAAARQFQVTVINASAGGIQLHYDINLQLGERIQLALPAPLPPVASEVVVDVVWFRKNAINFFGHYAAGVRFRSPSEDLLRDIRTVGETASA